MYEKQTFYSGQPLQASQLNTMEDGIIVAQEIAQDAKSFSEEAKTTAENAQSIAEEAKKGASNMQTGMGTDATQQPPRMEKMTTPDENGHFYLKFPTDQNPGTDIEAEQEYGAVGDYSASLCGRSSAQGKHSMAINNSTVALGEESFSQGYASVAKGNSSFAGGSGTYAKGLASVSLGSTTQAIGENSFADGVNSKALGMTSCAMGYDTQATGEISHSEGINSIASGYISHAAGCYVEADQFAQTVVGRYNDKNAVRDYSDPRGGSVFQIGIGTSAEDRKNAVNILGDGDVVLYWNGAYYSLHKIIAHLGGFTDATKAQ